MFFELIAVFAAGLGAAGLVLVLNHLTRGRLPRWAAPVAAGLAMIAMSVWSEMSWAQRTAANLPEGVVVVDTVSHTSWWRPWTYLLPQTSRLMAVDTVTVQRNDAAPDIRLAEVYLFARWQPVAKIPQMIRCSAPARADVTDTALADPSSAQWLDLPADNTLAQTVCKE